VHSAQAYGCDCENLHVVNFQSDRMTVIAIGWTRGNKKAIATVMPTAYWDKLRKISKFDKVDIQAAHKILKRETSLLSDKQRTVQLQTKSSCQSIDRSIFI
jgi:hypothetical protein